MNNFFYSIKEFFIKEESPSHIVFGQSYNVKRTLKTGNIALLISIITLIIVIILML
jgi:hypothetical protein